MLSPKDFDLGYDWLEAGRRSMDEGDLGRAEAELTQAIAIFDEESDIPRAGLLKDRAEVYARTGRPMEALADLALADQCRTEGFNPLGALGLLLRGRIHECLGLHRQAREDYELAALEDGASILEPFLHLSWLLSTCPHASARDGRLALEMAEKYAARYPTTPILSHACKAAAFAELGDFDAAVRHQEMFLAEMPYCGNDQDRLRHADILIDYRAGRPCRDVASAGVYFSHPTREEITMPNPYAARTTQPRPELNPGPWEGPVWTALGGIALVAVSFILLISGKGNARAETLGFACFGCGALIAIFAAMWASGTGRLVKEIGALREDFARKDREAKTYERHLETLRRAGPRKVEVAAKADPPAPAKAELDAGEKDQLKGKLFDLMKERDRELDEMREAARVAGVKAEAVVKEEEAINEKYARLWEAA